MSGKGLVLIADDDIHLLEIVAHDLRDAGYTCATAPDGESALEALRERDFSVALIDLGMPKLDGFQVLAAIQQEHLRVSPVVLTGDGDITKAVRSMNLGACDFVEKPVDPVILNAAVERAAAYRRLRDSARDLELQAKEHAAKLAESNEALRLAHQSLELKVQERTRELAALNESLQEEVRQRTLVEQQLLDRDQTFRAITDTALDAILMMDNDGRISFYNPAAARIFGWAEQEAVGKDLHSLLAPGQYRSAYEKGIEHFTRSGEGPAIGQALELTARRKDGSPFPVEISLSSVQIRGAWHAVGIVRDVTDRNRIVDTLRQSEERHRALFNSSRDAVMTLEPPSWRFTSGNPVAIRLFGARDEGEFTSLGPWDVSPERQDDGRSSAEKAKELIAAALQDGSCLFEWRHKQLKGQEFPAAVLLSRVQIGDGVILQASVRDITEKKRLTESLEVSEEKFRQIVDNIGLGVALFAPDMRILEMNRQMRNWFPGIAPDAHPVCHCAFNTSPAEASRSYCPTLQTLQDGKVHETMTATPQEGGARNFRIVSSPIHDHEGRVAAAIEVVEDMTDKLRLEQELNQAQKLESVGRLAAGIAHEINTPTQYVGDNIEFLQIAYDSLVDLARAVPSVLDAGRKGPVPAQLLSHVQDLLESTNVEYLAEQVPRAIEQSLEGVGRITTIVQAMREFSHPGVAEKTSVDLNRCIRSTATVSRNEWKYVADLELDLDDALPQVLCLPGDVNQAILNIIVNAAHAIGDVVGDGAERRGKIIVSTRRDGAWVEVRVADTGTGIAEDIRKRIFDPFFTTKEVGRGTGQGLAIARNVIVEKHGGTISVESEIGKGTTFVIRLPVEGAVSTSGARPSDRQVR
ncbi:MAG: PAS domain S-box protein [Candidatus Hydrogenedentes bacterium]|nr:PAS domain S-box protein [Candidatus Hydrogenedentota bacterium]